MEIKRGGRREKGERGEREGRRRGEEIRYKRESCVGKGRKGGERERERERTKGRGKGID